MPECRHVPTIDGRGGARCSRCGQPVDWSDNRPMFSGGKSQAELQESGRLNEQPQQIPDRPGRTANDSDW